MARPVPPSAVTLQRRGPPKPPPTLDPAKVKAVRSKVAWLVKVARLALAGDQDRWMRAGRALVLKVFLPDFRDALNRRDWPAVGGVVKSLADWVDRVSMHLADVRRTNGVVGGRHKRDDE